jgi:hypothetical protein
MSRISGLECTLVVNPPEAAGLGIDWNWDAIADRRVA